MTSSNPRRTLILDSSGVLHRCFHGYPPRSGTLNGEPIEAAALFGYMDYTLRLHNEFDFDRLIHVLDPDGGSAYRFEIYPEYKANRSDTDPVLSAQKNLLPKVLEGFGQSYLVRDGIEADDLIGVLARQCADEGDLVLVISQDKDLFQLVADGRIEQARYVDRKDDIGKTHDFYDEAGVFQTLGVRPDQVADYLAIVGDSTDNIPGVFKAGPKTAAKWLEEHGDLATLMTRADEVKGKAGEALRAALPHLPLYQQLTTLLRDVGPVAAPEPRFCSRDAIEAARQLVQAPEWWNDDLKGCVAPPKRRFNAP